MQSDALLGLVGVMDDMPEHQRVATTAARYGNPVICTQGVLDDALAEADDHERETLLGWQNEGLLVVAADPAAERTRLSSRPGYENRKARRARQRGKAKDGGKD